MNATRKTNLAKPAAEKQALQTQGIFAYNAKVRLAAMDLGLPRCLPLGLTATNQKYFGFVVEKPDDSQMKKTSIRSGTLLTLMDTSTVIFLELEKLTRGFNLIVLGYTGISLDIRTTETKYTEIQSVNGNLDPNSPLGLAFTKWCTSGKTPQYSSYPTFQFTKLEQRVKALTTLMQELCQLKTVVLTEAEIRGYISNPPPSSTPPLAATAPGSERPKRDKKRKPPPLLASESGPSLKKQKLSQAQSIPHPTPSLHVVLNGSAFSSLSLLHVEALNLLQQKDEQIKKLVDDVVSLRIQNAAFQATITEKNNFIQELKNWVKPA